MTKAPFQAQFLTMLGPKKPGQVSQTAKIEGGFVLLPKEASWLNAYILEVLAFPNSRHDDQIDSTVFALAWFGMNQSSYGWTDEGIEALGRIGGLTPYDQLMRRLGRF